MAKRRHTLVGLLGAPLLACLFGLSASPAMALSTTATQVEIESDSASPTTVLAIGAGGVSGLGVVGGFPNGTSLGHSFWSTRLGTEDSSKYRAAASFSSAASVVVSPSVDPAFLFIDAEIALDGGVEAIGATVATTFAMTGKHRLDPLFADLNFRRSTIWFGWAGCVDATANAPEPTRLLLFGAALVGLGAIVRRRIRRLAKAL